MLKLIKRLIFALVIAIGISLAGALPASAAREVAKQIDFAAAYSELLKRDLDVQSKSLDVEAARAGKLSQIGTFLPSFDFDVTETRVGEPATGPTRGAGLSAAVNLFRSGADYAGLRARQKDLESSEQELALQKQKAEESAVNLLIEYISSTRRRVLIEKIVGLRGEALKIARERYNKGILPEQEVEKVAIDFDNSTADLTDAENEEKAARARLVAALGEDQDIPAEWPWRSLLSGSEKLEETRFAIRKLPAYKASILNLEAENYRRHQARGPFLPSLGLSATYGNQNLSQPDRRDWSAVVTLSIPLFEKFQGWSGTTFQRVAFEKAAIRREGVIRSAQAQADALKGSFRAARESALVREKTAKVTERLYKDNQQRFRLGRVSVNDLASDQDRFLRSQLLEVDGWAKAHLSLVRLCHALGGFVAPSGRCNDEL